MQSNTYLDYNGIQGEANAGEKFKNMITLLSVDWSAGREITSYTGTHQDREASSARLYDMTITKLQDKASTFLFKEATVGKGVEAKIYVTKQGESEVEEIIRFDLTNAMISNYSISVQDDRPIETITISYTKMFMEVQPTNDQNIKEGRCVYGYDGATGQPV